MFYFENTQCEYFLIRDIQSADALSIEWMEKILLKPWAEGVKFYLLTAEVDLPGHFSKAPLSGRRATGRRHAGIDLFPYIAPAFCWKSRC